MARARLPEKQERANIVIGLAAVRGMSAQWRPPSDNARASVGPWRFREKRRRRSVRNV